MPRHAFVIFAGRTRYQVQRVMPFDPSILQLFITFLLISPSLSFLQQTRVTVPTFAVELMINPFLLISLLLPVSFIDRLSTDRANRPLIVAFHVFVTSFRRSLSRYRPQTPPDDDLYLQFRRFRRNWRSRVQDARGFFLVGIVFGFLLWLWVWIFFCLLLDCLFFWFAFGCVWLLFLCVLFWLAFRFALFLVRISVLIAFPVCSVSVPEHGMQKAPRHSGADRFPNRFAATGATGAISIRWPAQNHLRYRTVAWKTIHSPGGSIWSIGFGTGLAVRRRISSLGPISGPNNPKWIESDIGFDGWKFPISEPQGTCHTDGPSGPVLGL